MRTITKRVLTERLAAKCGIHQSKAAAVIQGFLDEIIDELAEGNRIEIRNFGVFEPRRKAERSARNPQTGAEVLVPPKTVVKFKMGRVMKEKMQPTLELPPAV